MTLRSYFLFVILAGPAGFDSKNESKFFNFVPQKMAGDEGLDFRWSESLPFLLALKLPSKLGVSLASSSGRTLWVLTLHLQSK